MASAPIYPGQVKTSKTTAITTANTAMDGTGTVATLLTAGGNGSRIDKITVTSLGTNVATVMRFWVNDGLGTAAANNTLAHEITVAATTASQVAATAVTDVVITRGAEYLVPIPYLGPGQKINVTIGTAVAAGVQVTAYYGDY